MECYSVEPAQTFEEAKAACQAKNGNLTADIGLKGREYLKKLLLEKKVDQAWIGGKEQTLGSWIFSTGESAGELENV